MFTIQLLTTCVSRTHAIEACGTDAHIKMDGRVKNLDKVHQAAFDRVSSLKKITSQYVGFNVYKDGKCIETHRFAGFHDLPFLKI